MSADLLAEHAGARAYRAHWRDLLDVVAAEGGCDALIVDAPYSEKTHTGHDGGAVTANKARAHAARRGAEGEPTETPGEIVSRRALSYGPWSAGDVDAFVEAWAPLARGWLVSLTDHVLAPAWTAAFERVGRYVFSPLSCLEPGSRVRMTGDGPAQWSCHAIVARPRTAPFVKWGALPGGYVVPSGFRSRGSEAAERVIGGKPLWLMERLVEDYSRPGQLVVDPCMGAGTTLVAAQRTGRRAIGGDALEAHALLAAKRIALPAQAPLLMAGGES